MECPLHHIKGCGSCFRDAVVSVKEKYVPPSIRNMRNKPLLVDGVGEFTPKEPVRMSPEAKEFQPQQRRRKKKTPDPKKNKKRGLTPEQRVQRLASLEWRVFEGLPGQLDAWLEDNAPSRADTATVAALAVGRGVAPSHVVAPQELLDAWAALESPTGQDAIACGKDAGVKRGLWMRSFAHDSTEVDDVFAKLAAASLDDSSRVNNVRVHVQPGEGPFHMQVYTDNVTDKKDLHLVLRDIQASLNNKGGNWLYTAEAFLLLGIHSSNNAWGIDNILFGRRKKSPRKPPKEQDTPKKVRDWGGLRDRPCPVREREDTGTVGTGEKEDAATG